MKKIPVLVFESTTAPDLSRLVLVVSYGATEWYPHVTTVIEVTVFFERDSHRFFRLVARGHGAYRQEEWAMASTP